MILLWNVMFMALLSASILTVALFFHLCACFTCSSVHISILHPLFAHHHLCYFNDFYAFDLTFVLLYYWFTSLLCCHMLLTDFCYPIMALRFYAALPLCTSSSNLLYRKKVLGFPSCDKDDTLIQAYRPCHMTNSDGKIYPALIKIFDEFVLSSCRVL